MAEIVRTGVMVVMGLLFAWSLISLTAHWRWRRELLVAVAFALLGVIVWLS